MFYVIEHMYMYMGSMAKTSQQIQMYTLMSSYHSIRLELNLVCASNSLLHMSQYTPSRHTRVSNEISTDMNNRIIIRTERDTGSFTILRSRATT